MSDLKNNLVQALHNRQELIAKLHQTDTDSYRLFHGINEGYPGLTIDRYGAQILVQAFHASIPEEALGLINQTLKEHLENITDFVYHDRTQNEGPGKETQKQTCRELGVVYTIRGQHRGQDPLLFLDMRVGRRYVLANTRDLSVLNLFAYTCGMGVCAALGGAKEVWNVDFAASSLAFGMENARLNGLGENRIRFIQEDVTPFIRQIAGLEVKGRGARKRKYQRFDARGFDFVVMDPPRWVRTPFGAIDLVRDYQSLFKPALLATQEGGRILCTNHVPNVNLTDWIHMLKRCAEKAKKPIRDLSVIAPEQDFPSPDGRHPLKMVVIDV